jgi:lipopolysaccharide transport system ATP-binding protein
MSDIVIRVEELSKRYKIGALRHRHDTLRDQIALGLKSLFRSNNKVAQPTRRGRQADESNIWALRDVSFDVKQGEVLGIIGRNGAGKSTLLKIMSRITEPTSGRIEIDGRVASLLEVGTGFHPELTGRENVYMNGIILGMKREEVDRKFDEIVAFAEIEKFLDTPVKRYSSGMQVRLAFAVAAHLDPEILVVDEVLAVGDAEFQRKCLGKMEQTAKGGRTVLFVSHNLTAVEQLCTRGIVLVEGRLTYSGTSKDAVDHYLQRMSGKGRVDRSHVIDLTTSRGRPAKYKPLLKRLELYTDGNQPFSGNVMCGGSLQAHISFDLKEPTSKFDACLVIDKLSGQRIFVAHTLFEPQRPRSARVGEQTLVCDIPSLPLLPGDYKITVTHAINKVEVDCVDDAVYLTITDSDFYGSGVRPWDGYVVLKHRWYLK